MTPFRKLHFAFFIALLILASIGANAQDSSRLRVSLITCSPGEELYSIFGHSAIRIVDSNNVVDYVFNYGTFDFNDPNFYIKFVKGKLLYFVSLEQTSDFIEFYKYENRSVTEQVLSLSAAEKINIKNALIENLKEENKFYKYDFFLDNCTTRLRDIILKYKSPTPILPAVMPENTSFRKAIHKYLRDGGQYWSELGIDILLGAPTDRIMTASEQQFLPNNLEKSIDDCKNTKLVASKTTIFQNENSESGIFFFHPSMLFLILFLFIAPLHKKKSAIATRTLLVFDVILFFVIGIVGIILVLAWFATDHTMTKNNYNLLWALPSHILAPFFIFYKSKFSKYYFGATALILSLLILSWLFLPQELNPALLPIVMMILTRSYMLYKSYNTAKSSHEA
jgi:hypothetical protein